MLGTFLQILFYSISAFFLVEAGGGVAQPSPDEPSAAELLSGKPFIYHLDPEGSAGKAYKLVYLVKVPVKIFWRFKTDFDNDFLLTNKYIDAHYFIGRHGIRVFTENLYSNAPDVRFRWQTSVFPESYRLDFVLLNPQECGQRFHYGHIQLEAVGKNTKVTQVAYFDFLGAFFWVNYPWAGGMKSFLRYTARWEQQTILRLKAKYTAASVK